MKKLFRTLLFLLLIQTANAQLQPLTTPNAGGNRKASISEYIGLCEVKIQFHRVGVKGREGKIWGTDIAHYGLKDLQFGSSKAAPWRVGANECTVISFSTDVKIEGKDIKAGSYGLFMNLAENESTVIFNKNTTAWGSYSYNPSDDVLQVTVKNESLEKSVEWLKFEFENQTNSAANVSMIWEKRKIPFKIEVDVLKTQFLSFKQELETPKGFTSSALTQAANFCLQNNYELEQGFEWANRAIGNTFPGERTFSTLNTVANYLSKQGKQSEADVIMKEAIPLGTVGQVNVYARSLLAQKRSKEAFDIYQANYNKFPNIFASNFGMVRAYSGMNDLKKALEFAKLALAQAPNPAQKGIVEQIIRDLEAGKQVN
jgi:tetratricopeptide (TPR) repeat protein